MTSAYRRADKAEKAGSSTRTPLKEHCQHHCSYHLACYLVCLMTAYEMLMVHSRVPALGLPNTYASYTDYFD